MTFGLTPQGFNAMRLADIKQSLENAFIAQFGDINLDPQSVFGQEIGVLSKTYADLWEDLEDVYFSQYPNSASGVALDNVSQLNGITRLPATQTVVEASCGGIEGTFIPANSLANIPSNGATFYANIGGTITRQNADSLLINVGTVTTQAYTAIIDNLSYTYSLPTITFSNTGAIFVSSNSIVVVLNGIALAAVPFNTDSDTTLADVATAIAAFSGVASAIASNPDTINITPSAGHNIFVQTPIQVTGGASQATSVVTFRAPADADHITAGLTAIINFASPSYVATDNFDGTLSVNSSPYLPFSCNVGVNLSITGLTSPIEFLSEDFGPVVCPTNSLTFIVTPLAGWNTINNTVAGVTGRFIETDAELRIRRQNSLKLAGLATVESIQAHLRQQVPGVTSAVVFENRTLTQEPIIIIFPAPFNSGDTVTVTYDAIGTLTVPYNTSQAQTMADLVTAFETIPSVSLATFGGAGNQTLTVNMNILQELTVNTVTTDVSAQTASITGGRPAKSFEAVVEGGTDLAVAEEIWLTKPAGIETFGNVNNGSGITIVDSNGDNQVIFFSRPTPLYLWVEVALTLYAEETFPPNGTQLVNTAINNYGNSLGVGVDVLFQRVLSQIFTVPGIASGNLNIASTPLPTDTPSYGTADISVSNTQISLFDPERIFVTVV